VASDTDRARHCSGITIVPGTATNSRQSGMQNECSQVSVHITLSRRYLFVGVIQGQCRALDWLSDPVFVCAHVLSPCLFVPVSVCLSVSACLTRSVPSDVDFPFTPYSVDNWAPSLHFARLTGRRASWSTFCHFQSWISILDTVPINKPL